MRRGGPIATATAAAACLATAAGMLIGPAIAPAKERRGPSVDLSAAHRCDFIGQQAGLPLPAPVPRRLLHRPPTRARRRAAG